MDKVIKMYEVEERFQNFADLLDNVSFEYQDTDDDGIVTIKAETKSGKYICLQYREISLPEIKEMFLSGEKIDLTGKYINNFDIDKLNLPSGFQLNVDFIADFSYWNGDTNFKGFDFGKGNVQFTGVNFDNGDVWFSGVCFNIGDVSFLKANFGEGDVSFEAINLYQGDISFYDTNFGEGDVKFFGSNLGKGIMNFDGTNFGKGIVNFDGTNFGKGDVTFDGANFGKGKVSFNGTTSDKGNISFRGASADIVSIIGSKFTNDINLQFRSINHLELISCTNKQHMKISGIKEKLSFKDSANLGRIEINWDQCNVKKAIQNAYNLKGSKHREGYKRDCADAAHDFLLLKENYRNIANYEWEDEAYFNYMKYNTKSMEWPSNKFGKKFFNTLFGGISGYGTRILNILVSCLLMILLSGAIYCSAFHDRVLTFRNVLKSMYFSTITFLTIGYGDFAPANMNFSDFQTFWTGVEGFAGLFLMSIFTIVIMRKVLR
ncbi:MAG: ion channel [Eubacteriales bacterium]